MTIIAVTASICANASVAALLVAFFMSPSLQQIPLEVQARVIVARKGPMIDPVYSEHPGEYSLLSSPHSANIDALKIDRQCGGNLARL